MTEGEEGNASDEEILPSYTNHEGYLMPYGFPVEGFKSGLQYQAQVGDLFVATYPKCGTTWCQHIVYLLLNQGQPLAANQRLDEVFPHLEEVGAEFVQARAAVAGGYRLIKTHLHRDKTPQHPRAKYVCVVRNPKDCVVSFYHHTKGFPKHYNFANGSFDTFFRLFCEGNVDFGDYFKCVRSWLDHRDDPNVLLLAYEHMRTHTREAILAIAAFLGPEWTEKLLAKDEELLQNVMDHSSIDSMKKDPLRWCSERSKEHAPFIRKGSLGGWDELLKPEQIELLDVRMREICTPEELAFLGEKY